MGSVPFEHDVPQVHHENRHQVNVSEFLDSLKGAGVTPNRVTYQQCVASLCQRGDVEAANKLIEERGLLLNESVLLSLLWGHCANNDSSAISATLKSLEQEGLDSNSQQVLLLMANCFAEKGNKEKLRETMDSIDRESSVKLTDGDVLRLVTSASHGGLQSELASLAARLHTTPNFDCLREGSI